MTTSRARFGWLAVLVAVLALVGAGIAALRHFGEWVDIDVPTPAKGEAARDRFYAAKQLARRLGAQVDSPRNFEQLPPPHAVLVLGSPRWNLFPGRDPALRRWVERGGRLVVFVSAASDSHPAPDWMPITSAVPPKAGAPSAAARAAAASSPGLPGWLRLPFAGPCQVVSEPEGAEPAFGKPRSYRLCGDATLRLTSEDDAEWQLDAVDGTLLMRVPLGSGSIVANAVDGAFDNDPLLQGDGALVFAGALQLRAGDAVWFIEDETRARFFSRLWDGGWPALGLAALALGLALWRGGTRFGPPLAPAPLARRSIGEQIRRTAAFIAHGGGAALQRAESRALDEEARRSLPNYSALVGVGERSQSIARHVGGDAAALGAAMAGPTATTRPALAAAIAVLEHARRALKRNRIPPHLHQGPS
ncbi:MAG: DUF4350 domain-containing protein [Caldimonas sp.]